MTDNQERAYIYFLTREHFAQRPRRYYKNARFIRTPKYDQPKEAEQDV